MCDLFLNFLVRSIWEDLVYTITLHKLPVSSCNLIVVFSTSKSRMSSMLIFVCPFLTYKLAQGQATLWKGSLCWNCQYRFIILQRYSPHQNLRWVWCWPLADLFDLLNYIMFKWQHLAVLCEYDNASECACIML